MYYQITGSIKNRFTHQKSSLCTCVAQISVALVLQAVSSTIMKPTRSVKRAHSTQGNNPQNRKWYYLHNRILLMCRVSNSTMGRAIPVSIATDLERSNMSTSRVVGLLSSGDFHKAKHVLQVLSLSVILFAP